MDVIFHLCYSKEKVIIFSFSDILKHIIKNWIFKQKQKTSPYKMKSKHTLAIKQNKFKKEQVLLIHSVLLLIEWISSSFSNFTHYCSETRPIAFNACCN